MKHKRILLNYSVFLFVFSVLMTTVLGNTSTANATSAKLSRKSATLWVGDSLKLSVKRAHKKVKWSSNKSSVATVSSKGKVKAKKAGKAVITAKVGKKKLKCKIAVKETTISKTALTIKYGDKAALTLINARRNIVWFSENAQIAYVENGYVLAKSVGQTTVTAKCDGLSYSCKITVVSGESETLVEDGIYTSKEKVALYIHTYKKLPANFITKEDAQSLGWPGGSLLPYAPYKCIGGNKYSNYEGTLPKEKGRQYYECDINTLGALQRGAERLVYSNDGLIYYTPDHYKTFVLLYN